MRTVLLIVFIVLIQVHRVFCDSGFGSVFPIPLSISNDDPNFQQCPVESGAYAHATNCSLFHMCTFGIHTIYSCIDGFFFNPTSGKCQYFPVEDNEVKCPKILEQMMNTDLFPTAQSVKGYEYDHRRKSIKSECSQSGIYPDVLACSLFHYCHQNKHHEIFQCPNGLHFDPKLFMCSASQLVNCQYEPPPIESTITDDDDKIDSTSTIKSNTICHDYASGTHLPIANKFDEFVICESNGKSTLMKCKPGFNYNALTTNCEMKPCAMDSILCKNNGRCVDDSTNVKGFQCICSIEYQGEYCENPIESRETTKNGIYTSTVSLLRFVNRLNDNDKHLTTTTNTKVNGDFPQKPISYIDSKNEDKISIIENIPTVHSPLSRMFRHLNTNSDHQQLITDIIQIIFITIMILIGLILLGSTIFGVIVCLRLISSPPLQTVGTWKILTEDSKV